MPAAPRGRPHCRQAAAHAASPNPSAQTQVQHAAGGRRSLEVCQQAVLGPGAQARPLLEHSEVLGLVELCKNMVLADKTVVFDKGCTESKQPQGSRG